MKWPLFDYCLFCIIKHFKSFYYSKVQKEKRKGKNSNLASLEQNDTIPSDFLEEN